MTFADYYKKNKVRLLKKSKKYYIKNKEALLLYKRLRITECVCGSVFRTDMKNRHNRSKKHNNYIYRCITHHLKMT